MSIGPSGGIAGSAAGSSLAQTSGSDKEAAQQAAGSQQRKVQSNQQAENAAGIGETEQEQEASDRDADGRRIWEKTPQGKGSGENEDDSQEPRSKDATGQRGNLLDLSG